MKKQLFLVLAMVLLAPWMMNAQTLESYGFTTGVDASKWVDMTSATQILSPTGSDGLASTVQTIGFSFPFGASSYTQYSVNTDGNLRLGSTATGTVDYTTPFNSTNANSNSPKINAFGCDGYGVSGSHYVKSLLSVNDDGDSMLVVEFCTGTYTNATRNNLYKWQIQLHANGNIDIVFPSTLPTAPAVAHQCGICVNSSDGWVIQSSSNSAIHFTAGSTLTNAANTWFDANRYYTFIHPSNISCPAPMGVIASTTTATTATLSWSPGGTETAWELVVDDEIYYLTDTTYTVNNLEGNTIYDVSVRAICGSGDTSFAANGTFRTACVPIATLPWTFEPDSLSATTTATDIDCFSHLGGGYVNIATRTGFTGNTIRFFPNSSSQPNILVLPIFDEEISNLYLTLKMAPEGASSGSMDLGYITSIGDPTSFVPITNYPVSYFNSTGSVVPAVVDAMFTDAPAGARIALRHNVNSTSWYWFVDELLVTEVPTCMRPDSCVASNITTTSATLNIGSNNSSFLMIYTKAGSNHYDTISVSGTSYAFDNLQMGSAYNGIVYSLCGDDTSMFGTPFSFVTECAAITAEDLPYIEDFESYGTGSSQPINICWAKGTNSSTAYPYPYSTAAVNGTRGLYFYSNCASSATGTSYYSWAALPPIEENLDMNTLMVTFNAKRYSTTTAAYHSMILVGVADSVTGFTSAAAIDSVVTWIDTIDLTALAASAVEREEVSFGNYLGNGKYVVFYAPIQTFVSGTTQYNYIYLDDIALRAIPNCFWPSSVSLNSISSTEAEISWVPDTRTANPSAWHVEYGVHGFTSGEGTSLTPTDTSVSLDELIPNTEYDIYIRANCGDEESDPAIFTFRTLCSPVATDSLPYIEDFESYSSGSANPISPCWYRRTIGSTTNYPYPSTSAAVTGSIGLYSYCYGSIWEYAALPLFEEDLTNLMLEFDLKRGASTGTTYHTQVYVGVMTNAEDLTTFDTIAFIDDSENPASSVTHHRISFEGYEGTGRIAFLWPQLPVSTHYNYAHLDNVVVDQLPDCRWPLNLVADNVGAYNVDLSWQGSASSYEVQYSTSSEFTTATTSSTTVSSNTASVSGLNQQTWYYFRVRSVCGSETSLWSNVVTQKTATDCGENSINIVDTIGHGTSSGYTYAFYAYSSYFQGYTSTIYTAQELADMGIQSNNRINGVQLLAGTNSGTIKKARVYIKEVSVDEFPTASDTVDRATMTLVYSGDLTTTAGNWLEIPFSTPFVYSGSNNLLITFARDTNTLNSTSPYFCYHSSTGYRTCYGYRSTATSTMTASSRNTYRANIVFDICTEIPNCARPANVAVSDVNNYEFSLSWDGTAGSYEVMITTSSVNPDSVSGTTTIVSTNTTTVTGLNPSTTYYYYVRSLCDASVGNSEWSIEGSVTTACAPQALPYTEDFESYASGSANPISPCWTKASNSSTAYPYPYSTNAINGQRSLYFYAYHPSTASSTPYYCYAALPMFQDSVKNLSLSFLVRRYATTTDSYTTRLVIGVMTNPNDISTFEPMDTLDLKNAPGSSVHGYEYSFNNYTGNGRYIAIYDEVPPLYGTATTSYSYAYVDDVTVSLIPTCVRPSNVTVSEITENTAKVSWTSTASSFDVEFGPAGHTAGTGTILTVAADSAILTGLTPGSAYDVFVRARCSASDISDWSFATDFYTQCGAIPIPYSEDFNVSLANHPCWTGASNATAAQVFAGTALTLTAPTSWTYASAVRDGLEAGHYYRNVYGSSVKSWMITPAIDLSSAVSAELSFDVALTDYSSAALPDLNGDTNTSQAFMVIISTDGGNTWLETNAVKWQNGTGTYTYASLASTSYLNKVIDLSPYLGDTIKIAFYCQSLWTGGDNDLHLDNIFIGPASACPRASQLQAYNGTASGATLEWVDTIGSTSWVIELTNEATGTVTTVNASSNPYTLTGLTGNTLYSYRVAPVCSDGQIADWSRSNCYFNTALAPATIPYNYDFENAAEWANWQTASNSNVNWYRGNVARGNSSNTMYLSADNGATHSWNMNSVTNAVAYRDIDFGSDVHSYQIDFDAYIGGTIAHNYDGIAIVVTDPAIPVVSVNTGITSPWGHVNDVGYGTVRHDTTWGRHTIYIDGVSGVKRVAFYHFNQATGSSNPYEDNPSAIDNVSITMQLCERPGDLMVDNVAATTAQVSWSGDATAQYEVAYRVQGQPASTNSYQLVSGLNATINGLTPATDYYWWVRRVCSLTATDTLVSGWVGASSFTTTCVPVSVVDTLFEDFESYSPATYSNATDGVLPNCWDSWNNSSAATPVYPHVTDSGTYSYCVSGRQAVTMTAGSSTGNYGSNSYLRLSDIAEPTNTLTIAFWMCTESSTNGFLEIGYLTGGNYATDFVALKRINASSATYHSGNGIQSAGHGIFDTVSFDSVPAGNFPICFRWNYTSSFYSVCLDDIAVWPSAPACIIPTVTVTDTTDNTVSLSWYGTATDYEVAAVEGSWNNPSTGTMVTGSSYTVTGLTPGTQYAIGVRAVCGDDYYSEWNVMTVTTLEHPCYDPSDVTATNPTFTGATIAWTAGEATQTNFELHITAAGVDTLVATTSNPCTVTGLPSATAYTVTVRAVCGENNYSEWSAPANFTTATCQMVEGVRASATTATTATITWTANGSSSYEVAYGITGTSRENCTRLTANTNSITINGLDEATTYDVYVRSVCSEGVTSDWSDVVTFETQDVAIDDVDNAKISLYPNPASSTVTLTGIEGDATVTVVDMNGREVYTQAIKQSNNQTITIDVTGYAQGAYFVRITGERVNAIRKLIVK